MGAALLKTGESEEVVLMLSNVTYLPFS